MGERENRLINQIDELITELYGRLVESGLSDKDAWKEAKTAVEEILRVTGRMVERGEL